MEIVGILFAAAGAFYAGYQRGRREQAIKDTAARGALVSIAERMGDDQLSSLGKDIRKIALNGLR